jgi:flagellar basal body-associated protein FliL
MRRKEEEEKKKKKIKNNIICICVVDIIFTASIYISPFILQLQKTFQNNLH